MKKQILLDHGSGGLASQELIESLFLKYLKDPLLKELQDAAVLPVGSGMLAFSTDSYVVDPLFFPGGSIGELAVNGTVNDLAMRGAEPFCLSMGLILEEGLLFDDLERVIEAVASACDHAGVAVVTGDTKVVPRGKADRIFINTSGIGTVKEGVDITPARICAGDLILLSGTIADHGVTIMTRREGLEINGDLRSDTCPLHRMVHGVLDEASDAVHAMRDPTRGGLGTALCEMARASGLCIEITEDAVPMHMEVRAACELMGLDPLYLANEGKCVVIVAPEKAEAALQRMRALPEGRESALIGRVTDKYPGRVVLNAISGGTRLVEPLTGDPLPRIC